MDCGWGVGGGGRKESGRCEGRALHDAAAERAWKAGPTHAARAPTARSGAGAGHAAGGVGCCNRAIDTGMRAVPFGTAAAAIGANYCWPKQLDKVAVQPTCNLPGYLYRCASKPRARKAARIARAVCRVPRAMCKTPPAAGSSVAAVTS